MKKLITLFMVFAGVVNLYGQSGEITGKVKDETGEAVIAGNVFLVDKAGNLAGKAVQTDFDGNYSIKPLTPGTYNVKFSYVGKNPILKTGVIVFSDRPTFLDIKMGVSKDVELNTVIVEEYKRPLIDAGQTSSGGTLSKEDIKNLPTRDVKSLVGLTAGVYQEDEGKDVNIKGGRGTNTQYIVDGIKVTGTPTLPSTSIEQLDVITGGIPAKYGDVTGGVVRITTKGPASELHGGVEGQTSQGLDKFGYNLVTANLTGPILKRTIHEADGKTSKKPLLGFFIAGELLHQKDPNPSAVGVWQVKQDKLDSLQKSPISKGINPGTFVINSEQLTFKDMYKSTVKPNTQDGNYKGVGRLDFKPTDNITLAVGGTYNYQRYNSWVERYTLLNSQHNPLYTKTDYRVYGRFTQNFGGGKSKAGEEKKKSSPIQNAYYTVQFDYEHFKAKDADPDHGDKLFDYGYVGKFQTLKAPVYAKDAFTRGHNVDSATILQSYRDSAVIFTPGKTNPIGSRFTEEYYQLLGATQASDGSYQVTGLNNTGFTDKLDNISAHYALVNGDRSKEPYTIWYNTGRQYNGTGTNNDDDQFRVRLEAAFDILKPGAADRNKHSIEFGYEFEQRVLRQYSISPLNLWKLARSYANSHIADRDTSHPMIHYADGTIVDYNKPHKAIDPKRDTITFGRYADTSKQEYFDKQLRKSLGLDVNGADIIDVYSLAPTAFSMSMFSADELLQKGAYTDINTSGTSVKYSGYDYTGKRLDHNPTFQDFFTKKDANGNYTREIGAFRPTYMAGYVQDKFYFKDLTFNVGIRVDRYDANQMVLRDPFSLYAVKTAGQVTEFTHPSSIGKDYSVYVNNETNPTAIVGYRNGEDWYDKNGNKLANPDLILSSAGGKIHPYLVDPNQDIQLAKSGSTFDANQSFRKFQPNINVMPRLQFSFNVTDKALFFAHYDILTQRPQENFADDQGGARIGVMDPIQYLYWAQLAGSKTFANPNLKPERTIDYELGFKQSVSKSAAVTISAFYREYKDQVQLKKYTGAYPADYTTFGNVDFGNTKGFSLDFDLRRTGNLRMKANYTMQFAEGSGSDTRTQRNIINAGQPNFKTVAPLDYDARHLLNLTVDYSFSSGKKYHGPTIKGSQFLSNSGINLTLRGRSGTPYSQQQLVSEEGSDQVASTPVTKGSINGSRLQWNFRVDLRIYKDFSFKVGKKKEDAEQRKELSFQVYLLIQNLLNTLNPIAIYRFTGNSNDDGYLSSASSALNIQSQTNPQSFKDLYRAYINRPDNYSLPRRIFLGLSFNF